MDLTVLGRNFDDDGFHLSVSGESVLCQLSAVAGHLEPSEGSLRLDHVVAVYPETLRNENTM